MKKFIIMALLLSASGCPRKGTSCSTPGETRCKGTKVQFCDGKKLWVDKVNCTKYKATCGVKDNRAQCMKGVTNDATPTN